MILPVEVQPPQTPHEVEISPRLRGPIQTKDAGIVDDRDKDGQCCRDEGDDGPEGLDRGTPPGRVGREGVLRGISRGGRGEGGGGADIVVDRGSGGIRGGRLGDGAGGGSWAAGGGEGQ